MPSDIIDHCSLLPSSSRQPSAELFKKGRQVKSKADRTAAMAVFAEENLKRYLPALRKITQESTSLHSAWSCLLTFLLPGVELSWLTNFSSSVKYDCLRKVSPDETHLKRFWNILIEDDIFGSKSTERMFQGFAIADKLINCVEPKIFKALLTPNFLRALSRHCSKNDNILFTIADQVVKSSISSIQDMDNSSRLIFVNAFRKYNIAGIRESLAAQLAHSSEDLQDSEASAKIKKLQKEFENTATLTNDEKLGVQESITVALSEQARNVSLSPTLVADIFAFLAEQIIFKVSKSLLANFDASKLFERGAGDVSHSSTQVDVEEGLSDHRLTAPFITAFDTAMRTRLGKGTDPIRHAECKLILEQLMAHCDQLTDARRQLMTVETPAQLEAVLDILRHLRRSLTSEFEIQKARSHKLYSIFYFLSLAEFYIMANPTLVDFCMAHELQELLSWDLGVASKTGKHAKEGPNDEGKVEGDILDAFVEAFLKVVTFNFAPLPSAPLRDAAEHLFRLYSPHVTETGVGMLIDYVAGHFVNGEVNEGSEDEDEDLEATTDKDADHTSEDEVRCTVESFIF
jgi:hypothetical protein